MYFELEDDEEDRKDEHNQGVLAKLKNPNN